MPLRFSPTWAVLALAGAAVPATAQEPTPSSQAAPQSADAEPATHHASPFASRAIDESELHAIAGREDVRQAAQADQNAEVTRNSVGDNSVTGDARIADNAFQNMSGLSILNVNTGNNVAINAAMNVNISIQPGL